MSQKMINKYGIVLNHDNTEDLFKYLHNWIIGTVKYIEISDPDKGPQIDGVVIKSEKDIKGNSLFEEFYLEKTPELIRLMAKYKNGNVYFVGGLGYPDKIDIDKLNELAKQVKKDG